MVAVVLHILRWVTEGIQKCNKLFRFARNASNSSCGAGSAIRIIDCCGAGSAIWIIDCRPTKEFLETITKSTIDALRAFTFWDKFNDLGPDRGVQSNG